MENYDQFSGEDKRRYERIPASGVVTFKVHPNVNEYYKSRYKDLYGSGEMIDRSKGGMRIKTFSSLEQGYVLEVKGEDINTAIVRWVAKTDDYYYAGLMYT